MKKFISVIVVLLLVGSAGRAQIPNAGFENWTSGSPDGWSTLNFLVQNISVSTTAHSGSSSARAEIVNLNGTPTGIVFQSGADGTGFPITPQRYGSVSGYYQFNPVGGDKFTINVIMCKGAFLKGNILGTSIQPVISSSAVGTWQKFTTEIRYTTSGAPDTCIIGFGFLGPNGADYHAGTFALIDDLTFGAPTSVQPDNVKAPLAFGISQNYPNPFNPTTNIQFTVSVTGKATLKVFNMLGQVVATLFDGIAEAGEYYQVTFSAKGGSASGGNAANFTSGVYFARLQSGDKMELKKMLMMK